MKDPEWRERLRALEGVDWSKKNVDWQDVCIIANSVISNRQARAATKSYIKSRLGMELSDAERRSIQGPAKDTRTPEEKLGITSAA
jgi:DNA sulfur modification protein DndB